MKISAKDISSLRERTGAGMMDVKKALEKSRGDAETAIKTLRQQGKAKAAKRAGKEASEGYLGVYVHTNGKVGAMVELLCETDFVARNEEFKELAKRIAMHVTAVDPQFLSPEDVTEGALKDEKEILANQLKNDGKPADIISKAIDGKLKKFREEVSLLTQKSIHDDKLTIQDGIDEAVQKLGENIKIGRFIRFNIGG